MNTAILTDFDKGLDDMVVIWDQNPTKTYIFGHEFGPVGYVLANSYTDAYVNMLDHVGRVDGYCDHGGDMPTDLYGDEAYEWVISHCDCDDDNDGNRVWAVNWWIQEMRLPAEMFCLAIGEDWTLGWLK